MMKKKIVSYRMKFAWSTALLSTGFFLILAERIASHSRTLLTIDIWLHTIRIEFLSEVRTMWMVATTQLGDPPFFIASAIALLLLFVSFRAYKEAIYFSTASLVGYGFVVLAKRVVGATRPLGGVIETPDGFAFPSGHATLATIFAIAVIVMIVRRAQSQWAKIVGVVLALALSFLVGFSRYYLGVHWASDVVGGWLLGAVVASVTAIIMRKSVFDDVIASGLRYIVEGKQKRYNRRA